MQDTSLANRRTVSLKVLRAIYRRKPCTSLSRRLLKPIMDAGRRRVVKVRHEQSTIRNSLGRRVVFAFLMGIVSTGMVSFTVVLINLGLTKTFWQVWLRSWSLAFPIVVPVILIVSPTIMRSVDFLFRESTARQKKEN